MGVGVGVGRRGSTGLEEAREEEARAEVEREREREPVRHLLEREAALLPRYAQVLVQRALERRQHRLRRRARLQRVRPHAVCASIVHVLVECTVHTIHTIQINTQVVEQLLNCS